MYLSKLTMKRARGGHGALLRFLADNAELIGNSHQLVWSLFGDLNRKRPFLYVQSHGTYQTSPIYVQSTIPPEDTFGIWEMQTRSMDTMWDSIKPGTAVAWDICVNAVTKGAADRNKKHSIVDDAWHKGDKRPDIAIAADVVPAWLATRFAAVGLDAKPSEMTVLNHTKRRFHKNASASSTATVAMTDVRGRGIVQSPDLLRAAVAEGFGSARAYGCGLLLLKPLSSGVSLGGQTE